MSKKVKVAVLGAGKIGYMHIEGFMSHPAAEVVALVDKNEERLTVCADQYDIEHRVTDYNEVLKMDDVDVVSIGLPNFLHRETAVAALSAGKHVLLEKPMAMNYSEAQEIAKAAEKNKKLLMVGQNRRLEANMQKLKYCIDKGYIGDPFHGRAFLIRKNGIPKMGTWFTLKKYSGGGAVIDIGVHIIDKILFLMGTFDAEAVSAVAFDMFGHRDIGKGTWGLSDEEESSVKFDVDDYAAALIRLKGGKSVIVETAWHAYTDGVDTLTVLGTEGGARLDPFEIQRRTDDHCEIIKGVEMEKPLPYPENKMVHFIDCIVQQDVKPLVRVEESLKLQRILDAIYESSETGQEVRI